MVSQNLNYKKIKDLLIKIASIKVLADNIVIFGGVAPYLMTDTESNRNHSDVDILVSQDKMFLIRDLLIANNIYKSEMDSLNIPELNDDYGVKAVINGIYVEFEPFVVENNKLTRKSFSLDGQMAGEETFTFDNLGDLVVPISLSGIQTRAYSPEFMKVQKEKYYRPKDIKDIDFLNKMVLDEEKYNRVNASFQKKETTYFHYGSVQNDGEGNCLK